MIMKIKLLEKKDCLDTDKYWLSRTPDERIAAVERIREHYYSMLGYTTTPKIKKIFKLNKVR